MFVRIRFINLYYMIELMEILYPLLFLIPLGVAAYQDWKTMMVSDFCVIAMWIIAFASGSVFSPYIILIFPVLWGMVLLLNAKETPGWSDITFLPPFLVLMAEFILGSSVSALVFFLILFILLYLFLIYRWRPKKKNEMLPFFTFAILAYLAFFALWIFFPIGVMP